MKNWEVQPRTFLSHFTIILRTGGTTYQRGFLKPLFPQFVLRQGNLLGLSRSNGRDQAAVQTAAK
jgi:hypothetical protein